MRDLVRETTLTPADFIWPIFIIEGKNERTQIKSMPGVERLSVDLAVKAAKEARQGRHSGAGAVSQHAGPLRNPDGSEAYNPDNLMCRALRAIKDKVPEIGLIADVALDEYSSDGQDGLVRDGQILNDETVAAMVRSARGAGQGRRRHHRAVRHDGWPRRRDPAGARCRRASSSVAIMSYAAKFASAFYGPFREAVGSGKRLLGDKKTYQLDYANTRRSAARSGAGHRGGRRHGDGEARHALSRYRPARARQLQRAGVRLSGERRVHDDPARGETGVIDRQAAMLESLWAFKRAGAKGVLSYFALEAARALGA